MLLIKIPLYNLMEAIDKEWMKLNDAFQNFDWESAFKDKTLVQILIFS